MKLLLDRKKEYGVVLDGGGARGAYQIGAWKALKEAGIHSYAAHLKGKNSYDQEDYTRGTAFLIGNEGNGLRDEVADVAECYIKIPMCGEVESLNAAVASSVLMFEAARQRR